MKPALFNTEMTQAILEDRKTATRRRPFQMPADYNQLKGLYRDNTFRLCAVFQCSKDPTTMAVYAPYQPGDILYVRETWTREGNQYYYRADFESDFLDPCETLSGGYPASCAYHPGCEGCCREPTRIRWHPSIHMPKEAARLFLRVTGVRVERLQDITSQGAFDEGAVRKPHFVQYGGERCLALHARYKQDFAKVWNHTVKKKELSLYGWDANPWVFVILFERITKDEAMQ